MADSQPPKRHLTWATPISSSPDPVARRVAEFRAIKMERDAAERKEAKERSMDKGKGQENARPTTVQWAIPLTSIPNPAEQRFREFKALKESRAAKNTLTPAGAAIVAADSITPTPKSLAVALKEIEARKQARNTMGQVDVGERKMTREAMKPVASVADPQHKPKKSGHVGWSKTIAKVFEPDPKRWAKELRAKEVHAMARVILVENLEREEVAPRRKETVEGTLSSSSAGLLFPGSGERRPSTTAVCVNQAQVSSFASGAKAKMTPKTRPSVIVPTQRKPDIFQAYYGTVTLQPKSQEQSKPSAPVVTVQEVGVHAESRMERLIRRLRYELSWLCNFDQEPLSVEEMSLLQLESGMKGKLKPSRSAPWFAYAAVVGLILGMFVVYSWVFLS